MCVTVGESTEEDNIMTLLAQRSPIHLLIAGVTVLAVSLCARPAPVLATAPAPSFYHMPALYTNADITNPGGVATGDFNGDGFTDLAVTDYFDGIPTNCDNRLVVLLGHGDG